MRSTPATVLGVAEPFREVFSSATGLSASWFSANGRGACPSRKGKGVVVTDLAFLDDVRTACDACAGTRFGPRALAATLDGHTIAGVLMMGAAPAAALFTGHTRLSRRLRWLDRVGLGHLSIGQGLDTLSGGERQRLLLARHLAETEGREDLRLVLDEPTAGLHGHDVDRFLTLCDELVDAGATLVVVEHDQQVIAHADHVIDVGPGAGSEGGTLVFTGTLAGLAEHPGSLTGRYLHRTAAGAGAQPASARR